MLPFVARTTIEVLALVPNSLREASLGLGIPQWRTTLSIVLPRAIGGILTGTVLAVARVAGETAPLLFTSSLVGTQTDWNPAHALQTIPVAIFELSESPDPAGPRTRLGGRIRPPDVHHVREPHRALARQPKPPQDRRPLMEGAEDMSTTIEPADEGRDPPPADAAARAARDDLPRREPRRDLRPQGGGQGRDDGDLQEPRHRHHRPVRLRQEHVHPLLQPDERPHPGLQADGHDPLPRAGHLRDEHRPGRRAPEHRHGLPAAEPVPEVDLRQRRVGLPRARHEGRTSTSASSARSRRPRSGTR